MQKEDDPDETGARNIVGAVEMPNSLLAGRHPPMAATRLGVLDAHT